MEVFFLITIFVISLAVMIKGADWFLESSEKIGLAMGLSPFIVGVLIVGLGTSLPELISSLVATTQGQVDIAAANAIGSNIANILLVIGLAAQFAKNHKIEVTKNLTDIDIPLLASATFLFFLVAFDGKIVFLESVLLLLTYGIYLLYTLLHKDEQIQERGTELLEEFQKQQDLPSIKKKKANFQDIWKMVFGLIGLVLGARYLIASVVDFSILFQVATGLIAVTAIAVGTSLPELLVSVRAAMAGKGDVALGNIFGSNIFNMFIVVGVPGLLRTLTIDAATLTLGLPVLAAATFLFIISGFSRRIHIWEGGFFLVLYAIFVAKLFNLF